MAVLLTVCPKCGFPQERAEECLRCGIIFARYRGPVKPSAPPRAHPVRTALQHLHRLYRILRWVSLAGAVLALILALRPERPPDVAVTPEDVQRAETKVAEFQTSARQGSGTLDMDEPELNGWLGASLATASGVKEAEPSVAVRDVKIQLGDDALRAYIAFEAYGKDLSLELEGRLSVRDGCLFLEPTAGKLGSLPLASATLEAAKRRLFESPENREKLRLPSEIRDIRVDHGHLMVSTR